MSSILNYKQAAEVLSIPLGSLYALVSRGDIPHYRYGKRWVRFSEEELLEWVNTKKVCAKQKAAVTK